MMTRDDVLKRFVEEADKLDKTYIRRNDIILQLAQLVADSRTSLSDESFAALLRIGAAIYKANLRQNRARKEIATIMRESINSGSD
ncbi:hypothetical protein [Noviherbaspirillum sedimenti]|nr:hypothetical protein [Noviherbaspirillum sedimenti]